jgi:hypothetical protein
MGILKVMREEVKPLIYKQENPEPQVQSIDKLSASEKVEISKEPDEEYYDEEDDKKYSMS